MDDETAISAFAALAHPQRMRIYRILTSHGTNGLPASEIAEAVGATPTAASFHLKELCKAGLIHGTRQGRFIRYALHVDGMRRLLTYLTNDCCQGHPELCGSAVAGAATLYKFRTSSG